MSNKKKSSRKRARRMRGREKRALLVMGLIVGSVGITLTVRGNALNQQIQQNSLKESALEQQLEDETKRREEIQELEQYMQSDEYIEKIAREKLGLLKENEILFREQIVFWHDGAADGTAVRGQTRSGILTKSFSGACPAFDIVL